MESSLHGLWDGGEATLVQAFLPKCGVISHHSHNDALLPRVSAECPGPTLGRRSRTPLAALDKGGFGCRRRRSAYQLQSPIHNLWATMGRTRAREREGAHDYPPMNDLPILIEVRMLSAGTRCAPPLMALNLSIQKWRIPVVGDSLCDQRYRLIAIDSAQNCH